MDFERKYSTRFWTLLDELADTAELADELDDYKTVLENLRHHNEENRKNEELLKLGIAVVCPEMEEKFRELASKACCIAEQCVADISVKGEGRKRGRIELKSDMLMLPLAVHREILAELLQASDECYIDAIDGETRITLLFNLFAVKYEQ